MDIDYVGQIWAVAVTLNIILSLVSKILDKVKDKTSSKIDDKIYLYLNKGASALKKLIDWASANRSHR